jgi:hypothetical protein
MIGSNFATSMAKLVANHTLAYKISVIAPCTIILISVGTDRNI